MKELEAASGVPRSTIHYYLKAGILPEPEKTARNAAIYDERHLRRLQAIDYLKRQRGALPLGLLKRAAELMERGVEPEVALELERAVVGSATVEGTSERMSERELAEAAGAPLEFVQTMIECKLLVPLPGQDPPFDETDLRLVQVVHPLAQATGLDLRVAIRISETIRDLSRYEMSLRNLAVAGNADREAFDLTRSIQEGVNAIHAYLFYRYRLHDIAELQRQEASTEQETRP